MMSPFQENKAYFLEASYFDELPEEREVAIARPRGIPLSAWEDLDGNKPDPGNFPHTSTHHPRCSKKNKPNRKKRTQREDDSLEKIHLVDGRMNYLPWAQILLQYLGHQTVHVCCLEAEDVESQDEPVIAGQTEGLGRGDSGSKFSYPKRRTTADIRQYCPINWIETGTPLVGGTQRCVSVEICSNAKSRPTITRSQGLTSWKLS